MKIHKPKNKKIVIAVVTIALVVILLLTYLYIFSGHLLGWSPNQTPSSTTLGTNPPSRDQVNAGQQTKLNSTNNNSKQSGSDTPEAPVTQTDGSKKVEVDIISINRVESTIKVNVLISLLDQSGSCRLSVTNQSGVEVYSQTVGIQAQANSSTCKGYTIAQSVLPAGTYNFRVTYSNESTNSSGSASEAYVSS